MTRMLIVLGAPIRTSAQRFVLALAETLKCWTWICRPFYVAAARHS
jgi:hypothetical protein